MREVGDVDFVGLDTSQIGPFESKTMALSTPSSSSSQTVVFTEHPQQQSVQSQSVSSSTSPSPSCVSIRLAAPKKSVKWDQATVDNEHLGKKSSKGKIKFSIILCLKIALYIQQFSFFFIILYFSLLHLSSKAQL